MRGQRGQAIVLIALMLSALIGMAAIAIDGSRAYALRRELQAAVDSASLTAGDRLQQTGSWSSAEQAAESIFANNLQLSGVPCSGWGSPGAAAWTVTCTFSDGTMLTEVAQGLGPQGGQFTISAQRNLQLQFGRILTNGSSPTLAVTATGNVNNQRYTPAIAALNQAGCGGAGGSAITVSGSGTLGITGDVVSNGAISIAGGGLRVAGDIYARCQSPVPGAVTNACYPSGAALPCGYPDVAGATRSGFRLADPGYPAPSNLGSGQVFPATVTAQPGIYSSPISFVGGHCWFLSGGVYTFQAGVLNSADVVSNELKPPDEPVATNNTLRSLNQFWNTDGVNCAGSFQLTKTTGAVDVPTGNWSFVVTSLRTDTYNGAGYARESAPSMCQQINVNNHFDEIQLTVSNVPGATSYNIYAAPPGNGCSGPFGLAANLAVSGPVLNTNTNPCPLFTGSGCTLGHESVTLGAQLVAPFATNSAYPPDGETAPIAAGLPNQNPPTGPGTRGDRANENSCAIAGGGPTICPAAITPGAVELYFEGGCDVSTNGDTYVFSGYQFNWISVYQPAANTCSGALGGAANSAYVGLYYAPGSALSITSPYGFEAAGVGGVIANTLSFSGAMPSVSFSGTYAPVAPASRLTG